MIGFPGSKFNLGLQVLRKRGDGYHDIRSIFIPLQLTDILEILPSTTLNLTCSGLPISGKLESNLVLKAYHLIHQRHTIDPVNIHLHKLIPEGSGLGAGSADGAKTLEMLNTIFEIGLSKQTLKEYALELGSDCPFFIDYKPAVIKGRGEIIEEIRNPLIGWYIQIIRPVDNVSTNEAFSYIIPSESNSFIGTVLSKKVEKWPLGVPNDFEQPIFEKLPSLEDIKRQLLNDGAVFASMSGSGSAIYGLFREKPKPKPDAWFQWVEQI